MSPDSSPSIGAAHARILGVGGYRPSRVVTNAEICERIDSSDEWIRERSGIVDPPLRRRRRDRRRHGRRRGRQGARPRRHRPRTDRRRPASRRSPTRCRRPRRPPTRSRTGSAPPTPRPSTSPRPAPASATASRSPTTWSAAAAPSTCSSSACEKLSDFTDSVRPVDRVHLRRRRRRRGDRPVRRARASARRLGLGRLAAATRSTQHASWIDVPRPTERRLPAPARCRARQVFRWAVWQMAPVAQQALEAAGVTAEDLDAFIPHQANMRIIDAHDQGAEAARRTSPVARDIVEHRQHLGRLGPARDGADAREPARPRAATSRC